METHNTPTGQDPVALSFAHEAEILAAVAADPASPGGDMRVLHKEAFRSESAGNPYGFMVIGEKGMMGVSADLAADGSLQNVRCLAL